MRGVFLLCMTLATAALSGCADLVEDPQAAVDALPEDAVAQAAAAMDTANKQPGHIAGKVLDAELAPIEGALVSLPGLDVERATDANGAFAFVDLAAGPYLLNVVADGFLAEELSVDVTPNLFTRPTVTLDALPAPEAYVDVYRFDGYRDLSTGFFGGFFGCECYFEFPVAEGLGEIVLEGVLESDGTFFGTQRLHYDLGLYGEESGESFYGSGSSPMRVSLLPGEDAVGATQGFLYLEPDSVYPDVGSQFTAYVSAFYHGVAPEDYTAIDGTK